MTETLKTISPVDGSIYVERTLAGDREIEATLENASVAQQSWRHTPLEDRQKLLLASIDCLLDRREDIARDITWQMGRPISQTPFELGGVEERARHMIAIAPDVLQDFRLDPLPGFTRFIRREPVGTVVIVAPWNYPLLTAVNGIIPALMAGNAVILKHSHQTPLCAEHFAQAFEKAGLPVDLFQYLNMSHADTANLIGDSRVSFVNFTGSVQGGHAIQRALTKNFAGVGLELGGKDPAYVRSDANLKGAIDGLADGAFFNSGQCCCGIERIYVHTSLFSQFVDGMAEVASQYKLGNRTDASINLGPLVKPQAADFVRGQISDAVKAGAQALVDHAKFDADEIGTPYLAPQVLMHVDHSMRVMTEESFGPVVGVMKVASDEEALKLMNDSEFGLTASIWTGDEEAVLTIGAQIDTGTVYMNRCDYLDPALAWTGVKNSGRGCTLSSIGYEHLTRPKSFHLKTKSD